MSRAVVCGVLVAALSMACATGAKSASPSKAGKGSRVLDAVVVDRIFEPPGSGGTRSRGSGSWFLVFEAKDGEASVHYQFPVTHQQYNRFAEGAHVQLVMSDDELREIRPIP
jgi:hypothetical protein